MSPQSVIAHYRITAKLGEGGMGAVYRATDTKLNRDVAIKVLPDAFADNPDRLSRFTREAQVLASLNHPNIASIYGVEERALVLELVDGVTVDARMEQGPIAPDDALPLIQQLIEALEYAHGKGIVHRDLKPANLKLTSEGRLKVLDFGLAKALADEPAVTAAGALNSPTLTMRATMAGMIMGTAGYMSPEQARGQEVDERADIWAFGVVVYEMLTGRMLFEGPTASDAMASVLRQEIDFGAVPRQFGRVLRACLERDPRRRLRSIGDARLLIEEATAPAIAAPPERSARAPWIAAGVAVIAASVLGGLLWYETRPVDRPLMRFETQMGPDAVGATASNAMISPDGQRIAFRQRTPDGYTLATRLLNESTPSVLPGTNGVSNFLFSPDGRSLAFFAGGKLMRTEVHGGTPITLCETPQPYGATWLDDGQILAVGDERGVVRVPASGGPCEPVLKQFRDRTKSLVLRWPQALPGGDQILFTTAPYGTLNYDVADIEAVSLKTGQSKPLVHGGYYGRYLPTGHLVYALRGALHAVRFDPRSLETSGSPVQLVQDLASSVAIGGGNFDVSAAGTLVYGPGTPRGLGQHIGLLDPSGQKSLFTGVVGDSPRISPDGTRLVYATKGDLSVYNLKTETQTRITFDPATNNVHPVWSPDGRFIAYRGKRAVFWTRSDGSGQPVALTDFDAIAWSFAAGERPNTLRVAIHRGETNRHIWVLPLDMTDPDHPRAGTPEVFLETLGTEVEPTFSPDAKWIAYTVANGVEPGVYVQRYHPGKPASGGKWLIAGGRSRFPVWSRNGQELLFRAADGYIMTVDYTASGESFTAGHARRWSTTPIYMSGTFQDYDLMPDGKRAVVEHMSYDTSPTAVFLLNFFDEVKRKLP